MDSGLTRISTSLIRELVDNELFERGLTARLKKQAVLGIPKFDLHELIHSKSKENANIAQNNPEAINLAVAEHTLKQYALQEVFSEDVADAHMLGEIHLHDLGYPTRVYCSSHSLEYLKKYGLHLENLDTSSAPAKHARTLTGHLNTFLASMQAYYAGALGVGYINIFYAPYVEHMSYQRDAAGGAAPDLQLLAERLQPRRPDAVPGLQRPHRRAPLPAGRPGHRPRRQVHRPHLRRVRAHRPALLHGHARRLARRRPARPHLRLPQVRPAHQRRHVHRPGADGDPRLRLPDRQRERRALLHLRPRRGHPERLLPAADHDQGRLHDPPPGEHAVLRLPERHHQPAAGRLPRRPRQLGRLLRRGRPHDRAGHQGPPAEARVHRHPDDRPEHAALGDRQDRAPTAGPTST